MTSSFLEESADSGDQQAAIVVKSQPADYRTIRVEHLFGADFLNTPDGHVLKPEFLLIDEQAFENEPLHKWLERCLHLAAHDKDSSPSNFVLCINRPLSNG